MKDFYFEYKKVGNKFKMNTNLTEKMLKNIHEYDGWMLMALPLYLQRVNAKGEAAKVRYKELCEKNGDLLYNAAMIHYGIYEEDDEMTNYKLYATMFNSLSEKILHTKLIDD